MSMALALTVVAAVAVITGAALGYSLVRLAARPVINPLGSPPCDRCGNDTGKPWLWSQKGTPWHCAECDQWLTNQLFPDVNSADYDPVQHAAFLHAYAELKQRPTA